MTSSSDQGNLRSATRIWKSYWSIEHQEVVHTDGLTGEKHIADVKNGSGLVLEFQNSATGHVERGARESFYRNMIWVVNGLPFLKNIEFGAKLPAPATSFRFLTCEK